MSRIKCIAKHKGISLRSLALESQIDYSTLCKKLGGKMKFTWSDVARICDVLKIENPIGIFPIDDKKDLYK